MDNLPFNDKEALERFTRHCVRVTSLCKAAIPTLIHIQPLTVFHDTEALCLARFMNGLSMQVTLASDMPAEYFARIIAHRYTDALIDKELEKLNIKNQ